MAKTPKVISKIEEEVKAAEDSFIPETPETTGTALVDWEQEMARDAKIAAGVVANVSGNTSRFSVRGGILKIDDVAVPNNRMAVVILDSVLENTFFEGDFDPDNAAPPTCFAIGRDDATLAPHPSVVALGQAQHETCKGCPMNVYGSAERGKGKACKNRVRLMVTKAGEISNDGRFTAIVDPDHFKSGQAAQLSVPPTSISAFASFVKTTSSALRMPPHGLFATIRVIPDAKTQWKMLFEAIEKVPVSLMQILMQRHKEVAPLIEQPYNLDVEEKAEAPPRTVARGRPAVKRKAKY